MLRAGFEPDSPNKQAAAVSRLDRVATGIILEVDLVVYFSII